MATFSSDQVTSGVPPRQGVGPITVVRRYTIPSGFATNDLVSMAVVPAGAQMIRCSLSSDAAVGATANLSVGDSGDDDRLISSTAFTGEAVANNRGLGIGYTYSSETTIQVKAVSIATPTAGTIITLVLEYQNIQA